MREKVPKGWICIAEFETLTGINYKTTTAAIKAGKIPDKWVDRVGAGATAPYYMNPEQAALHWYQKLNPKHGGQKQLRESLEAYIKKFKPDAIKKEKEPAGVMSYDDAIKREQIAKAQLAELKVKELTGELVPKAEVDRQLFSAAKELSDAILAVPNRIADHIIAASDNRTQVLNILTDALAEELNRLSELIGSEAPDDEAED